MRFVACTLLDRQSLTRGASTEYHLVRLVDINTVFKTDSGSGGDTGTELLATIA